MTKLRICEAVKSVLELNENDGQNKKCDTFGLCILIKFWIRGQFCASFGHENVNFSHHRTIHLEIKIEKVLSCFLIFGISLF